MTEESKEMDMSLETFNKLNSAQNIIEIQLQIYKLDKEKISFQKVNNFQQNNMLRSILFNCLWNCDLALPEFENFEDMLTTYEFILRKFKYGESSIYSNGHKYLESLNTPQGGDDDNIQVQASYDYVSTSDVKNIPDVNFYLISRKKGIYDLFNNKDIIRT